MVKSASQPLPHVFETAAVVDARGVAKARRLGVAIQVDPFDSKGFETRISRLSKVPGLKPRQALASSEGMQCKL
jgi:hypothetical protein